MDQTTRLLNNVLCHTGVDEKIDFSDDGFVKFSQLLSLKKFKKISKKAVVDLVERDKKNRFTISATGDGIRANSGHGGAISKLLNPVKIYQPINSYRELPVCIHGTNTLAWDKIKDNGLSKMAQDFIHFATELASSTRIIKSTMPLGCTIFIYINVQLAMDDGIKFFRSINNVILCSGVKGILPVKYFDKVIDIHGNDLIKKPDAPSIVSSIDRKSAEMVNDDFI